MQLTALDQPVPVDAASRAVAVRNLVLAPLVVTGAFMIVFVGSIAVAGEGAGVVVARAWGIALVLLFFGGSRIILTRVEPERLPRAALEIGLWLGYLLVVSYIAVIAGVFALISFAAP